MESSWSSGQYEAAHSHSNVAKTLNIIGIVVGMVLWLAVLIGIIYYIATIAAFSSRNTGSFRQFG